MAGLYIENRENCTDNGTDNIPLTTNIDSEEIVDASADKRENKNNSKTWKKRVKKEIKMCGQKYIGYLVTNDKNVKHYQTRVEKVMGEI